MWPIKTKSWSPVPIPSERGSGRVSEHPSPGRVPSIPAHRKKPVIPGCQRALRERLLDQRYAGIKPPLMHDGISRVTGHVEHLQPRTMLLRRVAKGASVHSGHHDIGQQQVDPFRLTNERKRAVAIGRFQDPVIETAQRLGDKGPDLGIVLHHQHRFQAALWAWRRLRFICRLAGAGKAARQVDLDRGSFADLAVNPDVAAALSYEAVDLAEAETGPRAGRFCREERIERLADEFLRHADAGIRYRDHDVLAGLYPIGCRAIGFIQ